MIYSALSANVLWLLQTFSQMVPAYLVDATLRLVGGKPFLVDIYKRTKTATEVDPYCDSVLSSLHIRRRRINKEDWANVVAAGWGTDYICST